MNKKKGEKGEGELHSKIAEIGLRILSDSLNYDTLSTRPTSPRTKEGNNV